MGKQENKIAGNGRRKIYIWGTSWVMYRARKKESPFAIDENGLSVVGNTTVNPLQLNSQPERQTKQCKVYFGN